MAAGGENRAVRQPDGMIGASELATFIFCPYAWRLRYIEGLRPDPGRLQRGRAAHRAHAVHVLASRRLMAVATVLVLLTLAGLAAAWFALGGRP